MKYLVEEIFRTEGIPEFTFVKPPNYNEILVDIRNPGKPVVIEGQSGTGKTTVAKKIIDHAFPDQSFDYLSARKSTDLPQIIYLSEGNLLGKFIVDDFHRLDKTIQENIANLIKVSAEDPNPEQNPKVVLIGINKVGSELIYLVHDIAKRCGIHRVLPADKDRINELIEKGEEKLNVTIKGKDIIFQESKGDYWLSQLLCQSVCMLNDVLETPDIPSIVHFKVDELRERVITKLENNYNDPVKEFCRGKRFRSTNDPYYRLLKAIGAQDSSIVDLNEMANSKEDVKGSINNIKERRINILLESKPICEQYFYYNSNTKSFAIEDPALFYYLKHLNWDELRKHCGFRDADNVYDFDFAISFAGENRELAKMIADLLAVLDCTVFYDKYYEANYLGTAWGAQFNEIFGEKSRFVICLLDKNHNKKIWPTFERDCFTPRVADGVVIPIFLDDTSFVGIPKDIVGINYKGCDTSDEVLITDKIVIKLEEKLNNA